MSLSALLALGLIGLWLYLRGGAAARERDRLGPDGAALFDLARAGVDLSVPLDLTFHLLLPAREAAERCADALGQSPFRVSVTPDDETEGWRCLATRTMTPTEPAVREVRTALEDLAARHGGGCDGWEVRFPAAPDASA